jgi:tetratricopeptide (TPR) repeat protein
MSGESKENAQAAAAAVAAKTKGNASYKAKNYEEAITFYTEAIDLAPASDVAALCLCNRAICFGVLKNWTASAEDAAKCVEIKPDWVKGYQRLGIALRKQGKHFESVKALEDGVAKNPGSADLQKSLDDAKVRLTKSLAGGMGASGSASGSKGAFAAKAIEGMQKDFVVQQRRQRQLSSKLSETQFNMEKTERESQKARLVLHDMDKIDKSATVFGQVGKCFIGTTLDRARRDLDSKIEEYGDENVKLQKRKKALVSQLNDSSAQLKEMARLLSGN